MFKELLKVLGESLNVEKYASRSGVLQRIDPRVKLMGFTCLIIFAVLMQNIQQFAILLIFLTLLSIVSRIPLQAFFGRQLMVVFFSLVIVIPLPFITPGTPLFVFPFGPWLISVSLEGLYRAAVFGMRIWVCVAALSLLTLSTRFPVLLHGMQRLRLPSLFISLTALTYRYIFLFTDEAYRMGLAREARMVRKERIARPRTWRIISSMIGTLFIRAYERGEKVYQTMLARGFAGEFHLLTRLKIGFNDYSFVVGLLAIIVLTYFAPFLFPVTFFGGWF
ncbi:MAG: cobalt ECF transporter T component CbiQ [Candidatus Thorarchaeota archaeon]